MRNLFRHEGNRAINLILVSLILTLLLLFLRLFIGVSQVGGLVVPENKDWTGPTISAEVKAAEYTPPPPPPPAPPKPAPRPVQAVGPGSCESYRGLVAQYGWNVAIAIEVMRAESGCNPLRHNWGDTHRDRYGRVICYGSFGLFQIGCVHKYSVVYLENPAQNIAAAYKIYQGSGWKAWGVCTSGKVRCF